VFEGLSQLEFLHQLRNARLAHLNHLIKENDREDRELEITIDWARDQLNIADRNLAKLTMQWDQEQINSSTFIEESPEDQTDIIEEYEFYQSWLV